MSRLAGVITTVACLFMSAPIIVAQQGKRPLTIDDLITTVRVSEPELSPDTQRVLFVRTTTDVTTGKRNADIWSVAADGSSAPTALITGEKTETSPRFSPDGKKILFISTRSGDPQVFAADSDGKNIKQLTTISGGVQPPLVISPDSKKFAFVADVYPSCKDEACNKRTREAEEQDPVKMRVITGLPFRHWDEWRTNVRHHLFVTDVDNPEAHDITPGDFDSPTHFYEDNAVTFSADSRSIAFVSNRDGRDREMLNTNRDVWVVPVAAAKPKRSQTIRRQTISPPTPRTASCSRSARSVEPGSSPTAGISIFTINRRGPSGHCSKHPIFPSTTLLSLPTVAPSGSKRRIRDGSICIRFPWRAVRRSWSLRAAPFRNFEWPLTSSLSRNQR